jgi:membrane protease YdiL (CAAX protease family)
MAVVPYQLESFKTMNVEQYEAIMKAIPSVGALMLAAGLQVAVMSFILGIIGIKLARIVNLKFDLFDFLARNKRKIEISKSGITQAILIAFAAAFIIVGSDKFIFQNLIPQIAENAPSTSVKAIIAGVVYGGIVEEVLLRLFLMSLTVWILSRIAARNKPTIPAWIYVISILLTSVIFGIGHLPFASSIYGELTAVVLVRIILLNTIGGIGFGYLYWKKGLEYSMVAHMFTHVFMQLVFIPLLF